MSNETRPFLPEPEPITPAAPPKGNAKKTLILWLALIVMFLTIWQFLSPSPDASRSKPPLPLCETSVWSTTVPILVAFAFVGLCFFWFYRTFAAAKDYSRSLECALLALAEARHLEAIDAFLRSAEANAKKPAYYAASMNRAGYAQLMAGQIDAALASFAKVERTKSIHFVSGVRTAGAAMLAYANALAGDLTTSRRWVEEARARLTKNQDSRFESARFVCLAEAIVDVREGRSADGVALLEKNWLVLRETSSANLMRIVEVIRAFAESGGGMRGYNVVAERLLRVQPVLPGELAFLGAKWPEMQTFLAAHDLGARAA